MCQLRPEGRTEVALQRHVQAEGTAELQDGRELSMFQKLRSHWSWNSESEGLSSLSLWWGVRDLDFIPKAQRPLRGFHQRRALIIFVLRLPGPSVDSGPEVTS